MIESEYSFVTIRKPQERPIKLGRYTRDVAYMYGEILGLPELGHGSPDELLAELKAAYSNWLIAIIVTNAHAEAVAFSAISDIKNQTTSLELSYAYVRPEDRRRGIFTELFNKGLSEAKKLGATRIQAELMSDEFLPNFLNKQGFIRTNTEEDDLAIYEKSL